MNLVHVSRTSKKVEKMLKFGHLVRSNHWLTIDAITETRNCQKGAWNSNKWLKENLRKCLFVECEWTYISYSFFTYDPETKHQYLYQQVQTSHESSINNCAIFTILNFLCFQTYFSFNWSYGIYIRNTISDVHCLVNFPMRC